MVVYEVFFRRGVKVITLRSNVVLWNHSSLPIQMKLLTSSEDEDNLVVSVPKGQRYAIPLRYAWSGRVKVRPVDLGYHYSKSLGLDKKSFLKI